MLDPCVDINTGSACMPQCAAAPASAERLSQFCCYIIRPTEANKRFQRNAAGRVVLKVKTRLDCHLDGGQARGFILGSVP